MRVSLAALKSVLQQNVAEVKFVRRKPKPGDPPERRMLCTNSGHLLNSQKGRTALRYSSPKSGPDYNPNMKNLIITWDIFMQDYRTINVDKCQLISIIPADDTFWEYFTEKLTAMTPQQKIAFMSV
tara:strand:+ start:34 stop:411 length:378 start_codon:yes stop_codon:yes gene_type:complete